MTDRRATGPPRSRRRGEAGAGADTKTRTEAPLAALDILGAFAEEKEPSGSAEAKDAAARDLLAELAALDRKMVGMAAVRDPRDGSIGVSFVSSVGATVIYASGRFGVTVEHVKTQVPLRFNRGRGIFEGEATDASRVPGPGEPKERRRDALAVIAETIVEAMKKQGW